MMIELRAKEFRINGMAHLICSGEIHYFRLPRTSWEDRILKLKAAGCNAVASYVPWICHESQPGQLDLDGSTRPELDLAAFIDLCKAHDLFFFVRPGPFIMAEMKNEGIPYWVYTQHPESVPVGWEGKAAQPRTLDYLAPGFLAEVERWYQAVMAIIAPRLYPRGGNIIAVQLDNEIGMLAWLYNAPDLTDHLLADLSAWLRQRYDRSVLLARYPFVEYVAELRNAAFRTPQEQYSAELLRDLGHFMRNRFARYVATLRGYAERFGVSGVPFVVNIHGTAAGRGLTYPTGISQLYEAYTQEAGYLAGSDYYLGDLSLNNFQDLYLCNALMDAVSRAEQPLSSVEFECGNGDYGEMHGVRTDPASVDFKIRMCVAQGNRLLNYYLFSGGTNYPIAEADGDGNGRIAFTGERHGFAAPINPEGAPTYGYTALTRAHQPIMAVADKLAVMHEEHDALAFAFIPDYYMTEYSYPHSTRTNEIVANLMANRGQHAWESVGRALLLANYRFGAVDVQNRALDPQTTPVLVLAAARFMHAALQQKLVDYVQTGGALLLVGEIPGFDMEGRPCTLLATALGLELLGVRYERAHYYPSLRAEGWAAPRPEIRTHFALCFRVQHGDVLLRLVDSGEPCGAEVHVGEGRAIVLTAAYRCDIALFRTAMERLGARAALGHTCADQGIFLSSSAARNGERFLHMLNLDHFDKTLQLSEHGQSMFGGFAFQLRRREALLLPLNVQFGARTLIYATAEILQVEPGAITFRRVQAEDRVLVAGRGALLTSSDYSISDHGADTLIRTLRTATDSDSFTLRWR
jgi:beta-galactosidase